MHILPNPLFQYPFPFSYTPYSYEPLHPWKIQVLEEDNSATRAAVALLKDLFQCRLEPHARQVAYMANSHWYLRWNSHLTSQCNPPSKVQKQRGIQHKQKGSQQLVKENHGTKSQENWVWKQTKQKQRFKKWGKGTNDKIEQQTRKKMLQGKPLNVYEEHYINSDFQGVEEQTKKNKDKRAATGNNQQYVQEAGMGLEKEPHTPRREGTFPSCDNASFVSEVCRRSALHVAKVSYYQYMDCKKVCTLIVHFDYFDWSFFFFF